MGRFRLAAYCFFVVLILSGRSHALEEANLLAVSWQPAFCEYAHEQGWEKRECQGQSEDRFDASHFTLHGLWPQPKGNFYCGVSQSVAALDRPGTWDRLPELELDGRTRTMLDRVMPGTQSFLQRHQWIKHGTCYEMRDAETYFRDSLRLMSALNSSGVRDLVASRVGRHVSSDDIRDAFDEAFGEGAGSRVEMICRSVQGRKILMGLRIAIGPGVALQTFQQLIQAAPPRQGGCSAALVDPAGIQSR